MRWSQALIPTLKEAPAEAEILSHKLLLRAGLLKRPVDLRRFHDEKLLAEVLKERR